MNYALSPNRGWETNGRLFQVNVSVEEVNLSNNRFQDNVADMFVSALCENYAIKSINLSHNEFKYCGKNIGHGLSELVTVSVYAFRVCTQVHLQ